MLFDDVQRSDNWPMRYGETRYDFLNRSASAYFGMVRDLLEEWLSHVPADDRTDLAARLRGDNPSHESAFWELYLHEGYRRSGWGLEIHPDVGQKTTHPDFLVTPPDSAPFFLEAIAVGKPPVDAGRERRLADLQRLIDEMHFDHFALWVDVNRVGTQAPKSGQMRKDLRGWVAGLDPAAVAAAGQVGFHGLPRHRWEFDGWDMEFRALPLKAERQGQARHAIGVIGPGEATVVDNVTPLKRVLEVKHGRYGVLEAPLVIAVMSNTDISTKAYEVDQALYGLSNRRPTDPTWRGEDVFTDGFWRTRTGWRRSHCPQVIVARGLSPWTVVRGAPAVWTTFEPGVAAPAQPEWLARGHAEGEPHEEPGSDTAVHFDLDPEAWLADPDFY